MSGGDGAEGDGSGAGLGEAAGVGADGLAEVALEEREGKEAAVRLDLHLSREPAGGGRVGLRGGHSHGRKGSRRTEAPGGGVWVLC